MRRDPLFEDNSLLPDIHSKRVGDRILSYIDITYPPSICPTNYTDSSLAKANFITNAQLLLDILGFNSYALNMRIEQRTVKPSKDNTNAPTDVYATVSMQLPATLWSQQVLKLRKDQPNNAFELKLLDAYARRGGLRLEALSTEVSNDIDLSHLIRVSAA